MMKGNSVRILIADDDEDDRMLISDAFEEARLTNPVDFVKDGEELMDYLLRRGDYSHLTEEHKPGIILLDLNMPKKDGRTALREIRENEELKNIPIVVLTTSKSEEDILKTYNLGVNSFITKPVTFDRLVEVVQIIGKYWIEIVAIPANV